MMYFQTYNSYIRDLKYCLKKVSKNILVKQNMIKNYFYWACSCSIIAEKQMNAPDPCFVSMHA